MLIDRRTISHLNHFSQHTCHPTLVHFEQLLGINENDFFAVSTIFADTNTNLSILSRVLRVGMPMFTYNPAVKLF